MIGLVQCSGQIWYIITWFLNLTTERRNIMETHFFYLRDMKMSKVMNRAMRRKHRSSTVLFLPGGTSWLSSPALEWTLNMQLRDYIWQEARDSSLIYTCVDIHRTAVVAPAMKMNAKTFPWSRLMLLVKGRCSPIFYSGGVRDWASPDHNKQ